MEIYRQLPLARIRERQLVAGATSIPALAGIFFRQPDYVIPDSIEEIELGSLNGACKNLSRSLLKDGENPNSTDLYQIMGFSQTGEITSGQIKSGNAQVDPEFREGGRFAELHAYRVQACVGLRRLSGSIGIRHILNKSPRSGDMHGLLTGRTPMTVAINPRSWDIYTRSSDTKVLTQQEAAESINGFRRDVRAFFDQLGPVVVWGTQFTLYDELFRAFALSHGLRNFQAKPGERKVKEVDLLDYPLSEGQLEAMKAVYETGDNGSFPRR